MKDLEEADISIHMNGTEGTMSAELSDGISRRREFALNENEQFHVLAILTSIAKREGVL